MNITKCSMCKEKAIILHKSKKGLRPYCAKHLTLIEARRIKEVSND